jgi:hypothetical protein
MENRVGIPARIFSSWRKLPLWANKNESQLMR